MHGRERAAKGIWSYPERKGRGRGKKDEPRDVEEEIREPKLPSLSFSKTFLGSSQLPYITRTCSALPSDSSTPKPARERKLENEGRKRRVVALSSASPSFMLPALCFLGLRGSTATRTMPLDK